MTEGPPFDDLQLELIARNPARNIHRRYGILASADLFGAVIVETHWGRIGAAGQHKVRSLAHGAEADRSVRSILPRRNSARPRPTTAYRVPSKSTAAAATSTRFQRKHYTRFTPHPVPNTGTAPTTTD